MTLDEHAIHVCHVIVDLNVGGAELILKRFVESSTASKRRLHTIISLRTVGTVGLQLTELGFQVHALGMRSALDIPGTIWKLVRLIRTLRPDIVQTWMYHADLLGGIAARLAGLRNVIWGIRTTDVTAGGSRTTALVRQLCAKLSYKIPRAIVCAAQASRLAHVAVGYDASRMVVVPNGFDMSRLVATTVERDALVVSHGLGANLVTIGCLGRFHRAKDHENFVRAAGIVARQHESARFLMVGRGLDTNNAQLQKWLNQTGYADRFVLLGEREDVPSCLAAMDFLCSSSRTEGFPNVVGEAMAMGLPCVVTDVGDAAMIVADTGVVVPREDSAALASGMDQLLRMTPDARRNLGERARARIDAEFSMDRMRTRFDALYQNLLRSEGA